MYGKFEARLLEPIAFVWHIPVRDVCAWQAGLKVLPRPVAGYHPG